MTTYAQRKAQDHWRGYQEALSDLARALDDGGVTKVFEWIFDNANDAAVRATVAHLAGRAV